MGVQDVAETVLLVPRKGYWRIAGRGRGTVTRQLRGGVRCGCSWPRSRSPWTPARRGRRPRLAHPVGLRPMWQGSTRKWDLGEKRTFGAKSTMQTGRFRGASDSSGEHFFERAHSGKSEAPDARWGHLRGLYAGGWKSWSFSLSVSVPVLGCRPGRSHGSGLLTSKVGAGDHPGDDAQPAPQRLPLLGGVRRRPLAYRWLPSVGLLIPLIPRLEMGVRLPV